MNALIMITDGPCAGSPFWKMSTDIKFDLSYLKSAKKIGAAHNEPPPP
ncbi:MAG: hypothetical protein PVI38_11815 [Desulfobacterales bacterium]